MDRNVMNLIEPAAGEIWDLSVPTPDVPSPPTDVGLTNSEILRDASPLRFENAAALAAEAATENGYVSGSGTEEDPYIIRNLRFSDVSDTPAIFVSKVDKPLIIENVQIIGKPASRFEPAPARGIELIDCVGTVVRRCEVSRCEGIFAGGAGSRSIRFEQNYVFSCNRAIMSSGGSHFTATGNYTRDAMMYGVFFYNGPDHIIENNYIAWAGREGVGTNGKSARQIIRNNVILNTGWTAVNLEGDVDDSVVENNLLVDSHYGIIFMGNRSICRNNRIFFSNQSGIQTHAGGQKRGSTQDMQILDNLIVGFGEAGVKVREHINQTRVAGNRIHLGNAAIDVEALQSIVEDNDILRCLYGIQLRRGANDFLVQKNRIRSTRNGVDANGATGGKILNNSFSHNIPSIRVSGGEDLVISGNQLRSVGSAIGVYRSRRTVVDDNKMLCVAYGNIRLRDSHDCLVKNNTMEVSTTWALQVWGGGGNTLRNNHIARMRGWFDTAAIVFSNGTSNNHVHDNRIENSSLGVTFWREKGFKNNVIENNHYLETDKIATFQRGAEGDAVTKNNTLEGNPKAVLE